MQAAELALKLSSEMGLDFDALGPGALPQALSRRMAALGLARVSDYVAEALADAGERGRLLELLVVPETWFFRDRAPFELLASAARESRSRPFRVLSLPCSTGEEAWSAAMAMAGAGLAPGQFIVDAVDICSKAIRWARDGVYEKASFREKDLPPDERFFRVRGKCFRVADSLREGVRFYTGNVLDLKSLRAQGPFDAIFFRNLLIYLTPEARARAVAEVDRMLAPEGILFLGYAETRAAFFPDYQSIDIPRVYACRKPAKKEAREVRPPFPPPVREVFGNPAGPQSVPEPASARPAPFSFPALLDRADRLQSQGLHDEADRICREILEQDRLCGRAWRICGAAALAGGREEEAGQCLSRALYLEPGDGNALKLMARVLEKQGRAPEARRYEERLARLNISSVMTDAK